MVSPPPVASANENTPSLHRTTRNPHRAGECHVLPRLRRNALRLEFRLQAVPCPRFPQAGRPPKVGTPNLRAAREREAPVLRHRHAPDRLLVPFEYPHPHIFLRGWRQAVRGLALFGWCGLSFGRCHAHSTIATNRQRGVNKVLHRFRKTSTFPYRGSGRFSGGSGRACQSSVRTERRYSASSFMWAVTHRMSSCRFTMHRSCFPRSEPW